MPGLGITRAESDFSHASNVSNALRLRLGETYDVDAAFMQLERSWSDLVAARVWFFWSELPAGERRAGRRRLRAHPSRPAGPAAPPAALRRHR